jgi:nicotinamidase-related amidase
MTLPTPSSRSEPDLASLYLLLDLINDLVATEGPSGQEPLGIEIRRREVLSRSAVALAKVRVAGVAVAYVRVGFTPGDREKPRHSPLLGPLHHYGAIALGSWGTQVHQSVAPQPGDFDVVKHRVSAFYQTDLDLLLRAHGVDKVYVSGVSTSYAVSSTVREAHDRDLEIVLIEDCCAAGSQEEHDAVVGILTPLVSTVTTSEAVEFG